MYPVSFDLSRIRIILVGTGDAFTRRLQQLNDMGATQLGIYQDELPEAHQIKQASVLMVVGLDYETSAVLASIAKLQGVLVNVEDKPDLCDFHFASFVKRGDLTIAVSTNGASPTLGQEIRSYLARLFGEEWAQIVATVSRKRNEWKQQGLDNRQVSNKTREYIRTLGLLNSNDSTDEESGYEIAPHHNTPAHSLHVYENVA